MVLNVFFSEITMSILSRHATRKRKYVRGNQIPFLKKDFPKAMMERIRLRNKFLQRLILTKNCTQNSKTAVSHLMKSRKSYMKN